MSPTAVAVGASVGAAGTAAVVNEVVEEATPLPAALDAVTVNMYFAPTLSPVREAEVGVMPAVVVPGT